MEALASDMASTSFSTARSTVAAPRLISLGTPMRLETNRIV
eukprot:CAMPEP_0119342866 /NCGR_PEP_ID=MMETSP1333-20130426/105640_1 /TAXON_ID=418940 /ORGANISM="Scyphosphaera apsteinii, Strain RCC1455" /LENGTH=40 /DNA_ID= /DNA_START= /DNA_END= /DNA_ORIENTATION=